ncbi:MAG TPA: Tex family protein [Saprospiraceae bacterium]|nr:Tex family protein [Saprospiraceae bacterium]
MDKLQFIFNETGIQKSHAKATLNLLETGSTIPFIARYRKELTGMLDEVQINDIQRFSKIYDDLIVRKQFILEKIKDQGKLSDNLELKITQCFDPSTLEEIYSPYKSGVKTKADQARDNGLEGLAKIIMAQSSNVESAAQKFVSEKVPNIEKAIEGAQYIISEWVAENEENRDRLRGQLKRGMLIATVIGTKKQDAVKYQDYFAFEEKIQHCPSHRFLAVLRGESEGFLRVKIAIDDEAYLLNLDRKYIKRNSSSAEIISDAIKDAYKRLMYPSLSSQVINQFKEIADKAAIKTFADNLYQLLLEAPLGEKAVLALDPGFKTGCKVVCLSASGTLLEDAVIYPHPPQNQSMEAHKTLSHLLNKYGIGIVAIGNGTASRETETFIRSTFGDELIVYVVNESGASIYSASPIAREEFPNKDITVRGAVSIGRRLQDPLAELIKIEPKSIGVGQYQYDVNQSMLKESLDFVVSDCVNKVGVNLNTASPYLLQYISGLGAGLASNICQYREQIGSFTNINQLKEVKRLGDKAFEQASGFLRIREAENILDNTGVHPESYYIVVKMAKDNKVSLDQFVRDKSLRQSIDLQKYVVEGKVGMPTLRDIMKELDKPGLDIRGEVANFSFDPNVKNISELYVGMIVPAIVNNITNFGAFVDLGIKENGLLHISEISDDFIRHPSEKLSLNQKLNVKIKEIDASRNRISVSLKFQ